MFLCSTTRAEILLLNKSLWHLLLLEYQIIEILEIYHHLHQQNKVGGFFPVHTRMKLLKAMKSKIIIPLVNIISIMV